MVSEIRSAPLLAGFRGQPPADRSALVDLLLTVSEVIESYPEIQEMDLNPVVVREHGLSVADARIILRRNAVNKTR
jgi:acetyltransferase